MLNQPRKVLTPRQMGEVDAATIASGIPGIVLMETAAHRVVEYLARRFHPLGEQRIVVVCGKGNNGGDGLAVARQLHVRFNPRSLRVVLIGDPEELHGDAAQNLLMLHASGLQEYHDFGPEMRGATLVIDAVLGTGLNGPAKGTALDAILEINSCVPFAKVVAVDIPSGLWGDSGTPLGEYVRADATVTFTAPKLCHALSPAYGLMGDLEIAPIGSPASLYENDERIQLALLTPESIAPLFAPRPRDSNKGSFGHVLVVAGSRQKPGAAAMAGLAALRAGAGLVTVACPESALASIAAHSPELMTAPLPETAEGEIAAAAFNRLIDLAARRTLVAIGPGIGTHQETQKVVLRIFHELQLPVVIDADALNCIGGGEWRGPDTLRVLTPHPGEMSRLTGKNIPYIQANRVTVAREFAKERNVTVVLKGERTLLGFPDARVWINPTGSPAMATGGTGDILTGMLSGLLGQFPHDADRAIAGAVYLHGLAGEAAARHLTEHTVIATDLLRFLPEAIRGITNLPHPL
jgi:ADP-dependent NAD(P)H-hydrate dehydratase / NAD(P)H-hydrate epimerase